MADLIAMQGMGAATDLAIGGCSAGGLTVYLNVDAMAAFVPAARVVGVPDAGYFLDHLTYNNANVRTPLFQWGFDAWNSSATLSPACLAFYGPDQAWRCIFAQYAAPFIQSPIFAVNSKFDACQLGGCEFFLPSAVANENWEGYNSTEAALAQRYASDFMAALAPLRASPRNGGFIDACLLHCQSGTSNWNQTMLPNAGGGGSSLSIALALQAWYNGNSSAGASSWWIDTCSTPPCNPTC